MIEKAKPAAKSAKVAIPKVITAKAPTKKVMPKAKAIEKIEPIVPPAKAPKTPKALKFKKQKMVRDSFTMPQSDYAYIAALKVRCLKAGVAAKKSEVLRAALTCLFGLSDADLVKAIGALEIIKTGRPPKA